MWYVTAFVFSSLSGGCCMRESTIEVLKFCWNLVRYPTGASLAAGRKSAPSVHSYRWNVYTKWKWLPVCTSTLYMLLFVFSEQKQVHFRLRNRQTGLMMSVTGDIDDVKLLRIQEMEEMDSLEQIWFYQNGHLHCKVPHTQLFWQDFCHWVYLTMLCAVAPYITTVLQI